MPPINYYPSNFTELQTDCNQLKPGDNIYLQDNTVYKGNGSSLKINGIHGTNDKIISPRHSELLYEKYIASNNYIGINNINLLLVSKRDHNNL